MVSLAFATRLASSLARMRCSNVIVDKFVLVLVLVLVFASEFVNVD